MTVSNFFLGEADVASDDEEEPEYENERINGAQQDVILDRDEQAARDAIDARHEANKKRHAMSAEDIAAEIEARHKQDTKMKQRYAAERGDGNGGIIGNVQVAQQSFLPSVLDPKIFKVKCKPGNELTLLRAVMLKTIDGFVEDW
jgi:transcription elongation factor SPT5